MTANNSIALSDTQCLKGVEADSSHTLSLSQHVTDQQESGRSGSLLGQHAALLYPTDLLRFRTETSQNQKNEHVLSLSATRFLISIQ